MSSKRRIVLYFEQYAVATLSRKGEQYLYEVDRRKLNKAKENGCATELVARRTGLLDEIPPVFYDFEASPHRSDVRELLGIEEGDDRFDRLYKRALKSDCFLKDGYWIGVDQQ